MLLPEFPEILIWYYELRYSATWYYRHAGLVKKGKGRPYSITERRVPELIPVLGSQPAGDVSHKPSGRLPLLSARPAVTLTHLAAAGGQRCYCDPIRKIDADSFFYSRDAMLARVL